MTKWVEAKGLVRTTNQVVLELLFEEIFTQFGVHKEIVTYGGPQFVSHKVEGLL